MTNDDMINQQKEDQDKKLIEQWLANNKITVCESGAVTEDIQYTFGAKKKKK